MCSITNMWCSVNFRITQVSRVEIFEPAVIVIVGVVTNDNLRGDVLVAGCRFFRSQKLKLVEFDCDRFLRKFSRSEQMYINSKSLF